MAGCFPILGSETIEQRFPRDQDCEAGESIQRCYCERGMAEKAFAIERLQGDAESAARSSSSNLCELCRFQSLQCDGEQEQDDIYPQCLRRLHLNHDHDWDACAKRPRQGHWTAMYVCRAVC